MDLEDFLRSSNWLTTNQVPLKRKMSTINLDEFEAEALKLEQAARARLATRLLASLEVLSDEEHLQLWVAEAERRDAAWETIGPSDDPAEHVFQEARARLK